MHSLRISAAALAGALTLGAGWTPAAAEGVVESGKVKAATCLGCHGIEGYVNTYPTYHVPKVAGQHAAYIVAALRAYKQGTRPHPTMQALAATLSEQDMHDIAAYFASQTD
ncbi:MAG: c-type cytochrome [Gammaproteobacteria bacterium]